MIKPSVTSNFNVCDVVMLTLSRTWQSKNCQEFLSPDICIPPNYHPFPVFFLHPAQVYLHSSLSRGVRSWAKISLPYIPSLPFRFDSDSIIWFLSILSLNWIKSDLGAEAMLPVVILVLVYFPSRIVYFHVTPSNWDLQNLIKCL